MCQESVMTISEYLVKSRKTQKEFSAAVGVSGSAVSLWISGRRRPSIAHIKKIRNVTRGKVSYQDLGIGL